MDTLRPTNIIVFESSGAILKDGVTHLINAQLTTDCINHTLCRFFKKHEITSNFNFTSFMEKMQLNLS